MKKTPYIIALIILFGFSCNMSDSTQVLFGNYVFSTESKNNHSIVGGVNVIPPDVVAYQFDDRFLIAKQKPDLDAIVVPRANELLDSFENNKFSPKDSIYLLFKKLDTTQSLVSRFKVAMYIAKRTLSKESSTYNKYKNNKYLYWILSRVNDELYGPLTKVEYQQKRETLNIPENLKMQPSYN